MDIEVLVPPTVTPTQLPISLPRLLARVVRNPLRALPVGVYDEPLLRLPGSRLPLVWVTAPALVERILLHEAERFPKAMDMRVLGAALGNGLITAEGPDWRWQRKLAAPLFRHSDLLAHVPQMTAAASALVERWRSAPQIGPRDVEPDLSSATYDAVSRTILAGGHPDDHEAVRVNAQAYLDPVVWEIAAAIIRLPTWVWHPGKGRMSRAAKVLRAATGRIVAQRRAAPQPANDLLARLVAARHPETGQPISDEVIVDSVLTFLAAGHETTAKALTWTLYLLARSPGWQAAVRNEVLEIAGDGPVAAEHVSRLAVTTRVVKESLRLYPPAPLMIRYARDDATLAGMPIAAGTLVVVPIFAVHRHRKLWREPDRFDPDRFLPEADAGLQRAQFIPFGFGARICIGQSFAMIKATTMLATLVREASFGWDGHHAPEPLSRVTLSPKGGMPLFVRVPAAA